MSETDPKARWKKRGARALVAALCSAFFILAPIYPVAAGAEGRDGAEAALSLLEAEEAGLPPAKPGPSLGGAGRRAGAEAYSLAGRRCHDIMRDYAKPLSAKAFSYLKASLAYEENPLVRAYLGSAHLIAARDAKSVIAKVREVDEGLRELDAALKAARDDIGVRAVRIESSIELPAMFKRLDSVTADLDFLLNLYLKDKDALARGYDPARLFAMKAREQELRGKDDIAAKYRQKAAELGASPKEGK